MATLAPMPRASIRMAVQANPGFFDNWRQAYRMSCQMVSSMSAASAPVTRSFVTVGFPKRSNASRRASSGDIPAEMLSSIRIPTCASSSASISRSTFAREKRFEIRRMSDIEFQPHAQAQDSADTPHQMFIARPQHVQDNSVAVQRPVSGSVLRTSRARAPCESFFKMQINP